MFAPFFVDMWWQLWTLSCGFTMVFCNSGTRWSELPCFFTNVHVVPSVSGCVSTWWPHWADRHRWNSYDAYHRGTWSPVGIPSIFLSFSRFIGRWNCEARITKKCFFFWVNYLGLNRQEGRSMCFSLISTVFVLLVLATETMLRGSFSSGPTPMPPIKTHVECTTAFPR